MIQFTRRFGQHQAAVLRIIVKDLGVAAPVHGGLELAFDFILAEVFVENIVEKFFRNGVVRLGAQHALDALQNGNMFQRGFTEQHFAGEDVGFGEGPAFASHFDVAFF